MRHRAVLILVCICIFAVAIFATIRFISPIQEDEHPIRAILWAHSAKIERNDAPQGEYVIIDSAIRTLAPNFSSINVVPVRNETFEEDWIYRITFNCLSPDPDDYITVLVGRNSMLVEDTLYKADKDVPFEKILQYVEGKYDYFLNNYLPRGR